MTSKSKRVQEQARTQPHAQADIADLHAWATGGSGAPAPRADIPAQRDERDSGPTGLAGHPLMPKVLIIAGVVVVGYLAIALVVHLLMMLLMVVGGIAAVYAAYRIGFWRGQKAAEPGSDGPVRTMPWLGSARRRG